MICEFVNVMNDLFLTILLYIFPYIYPFILSPVGLRFYEYTTRCSCK
jgi:hypothetical protein